MNLTNIKVIYPHSNYDYKRSHSLNYNPNVTLRNGNLQFIHISTQLTKEKKSPQWN